MEALLTPEEVASRLKLTPYTIYVWLREGRLPGIKLGRRWRVKSDDLEAYLEAGRPGTLSRPTSEEPGIDPMELVRLAEEIASAVPEEEWERIPEDLCANLDHYLYGHPRKERAA